jgi:hypothetical protein
MSNGICCVTNVNTKLNLENDNFLSFDKMCSESRTEKKVITEYLTADVSYKFNEDVGTFSFGINKEKFSSFVFSFFAIGLDRKNETSIKLGTCTLSFKILNKTEGVLSLKGKKNYEFTVKLQSMRNFQGKLLRLIRML